MRSLTTAFLLLALTAGADPTFTLRTESQDPMKQYTIPASQLADLSLKVYSYTDGEKNALTSADSAVFGYGTNWDFSASMVLVNGTADTNGGFFTIPLKPSDLPKSGSYFFQVMQTNLTSQFVLGRGILTVSRSPITGGTGTLNLQTIVNWDQVYNLNSGPWVLTNSAAWLEVVARDHATLSNLTWSASGHTGAVAKVAGFLEGGYPGYVGFGAGMWLDFDDNIAVSNSVLAGAALGATALQPAQTNGWVVTPHEAWITASAITGMVTNNQPAVTFGTVTASSINFTNGTSLTWNGAEDIRSLEYTHPDGGTVTINGEIYAMWKNVDSVTIYDGQPVCLFAGAGRVGSIKLADADDPARCGMIGFYTGNSPLTVGSIGRVVTFGVIRDAPMNSYIDGTASEGSLLYLSATAGHVTTNVPVAPAETIKVGFLNYVRVPSNKYDIQVAIENAKPWSILDGRYVQTNDSRVVNAVTNVSNLALVATPISNLSTGAVITVTPTYQKKIYDVDASVPITLFTNDLSSVALNGTTNIEWVTRINYTVTNALSTAWESRIEWINGTPDLTVTGRYEFAFSTSDGVKIQGRQTYPSVYEWRELKYTAAGQSSLALNGVSCVIGSTSASLTTASTNTFQYIPIQNTLQFVRVSARASIETNNVVMLAPNKIQVSGAGGSTVSSSYTNGTLVAAYQNIFLFKNHLLDSRSSSEGTIVGFSGSYSSLSFTIREEHTATLWLLSILARPLNEIEIKHATAGGTF